MSYDGSGSGEGGSETECEVIVRMMVVTPYMLVCR